MAGIKNMLLVDTHEQISMQLMSRVEQLASHLQIQRIDKASLHPDRPTGTSLSSHDRCANVVLEMGFVA